MPSSKHPLSHPANWPTWLFLGVLWLVSRLPYRLQLKVGSAIGELLKLVIPARRQVVEINLGLCFPELNAAERRELRDAHLRSFGIGLVELANAWWTSDARLRPLARIEGVEHLEAALSHGKGAILLTAHFTTLEMSGRLLSFFVPFQALYRRHENPVIERGMSRSREKNRVKAIPRDNIRDMLRSLRQNEAIWYAPDQDYGGSNRVFVPFFGVPASTTSATSRLASVSGASVVPFFPKRLPHGEGYLLTLLPPLENFPSTDPHQDTERVNRLIEGWVRAVPEQYFWVHRRFKRRPNGEPNPYREREFHGSA